jgi:putative ABC transport system permease protein
VGRLAPGSTIEMAQAGADAIAAALAEEYPESNASRGVALFPLADYTVGDVRRALLIMFGVVGLVLLIACANVANLLLARGSARVGEMATRATLGASRGAIVRQLLVESLLLSSTGTILGVAAAVWGVAALVALAPGNIPRLSNVAVDGTVIVFAAIVAVFVALVFGTAPAVRLARVSMSSFIRCRNDPEIGYRHRRLMPSTLLTLEMALSLVVLVGAGLLLRSFAQIRAVDLGFDPEDVQQFTVTLPNSRYDGEQSVRFFESLQQRLAALPGVAAVGMSSGSPLGRSYSTMGIDIVGRAPFAPGQQPFLLVRRVTPGHFESLRIPLLSGRTFDAGDRADAQRVTLISSTAAERLFRGEDPIGKQFTFDPDESPWTIVGVVGDVRSVDVTTDTPPEAYFPLAQWSTRAMTVSVRSAPGVSGLVPLLRSEVAALDPTLALYGVETLKHRVDISIGQERFYLFLLSMFAALALALAAVGLYGVVAYLVSRRTREIGIRIALGARWNHVARLVLWQGILPTAIGSAVGLLGAVAGTRVFASLLYQVEPWDPASFALATAVLSGVALLATFFPAMAALRVSPTEAIKAE